MRDSKGAFGQDSRCDAGLVFCLVAAVQATRDSVFEGGFPDSQFDRPRGTLRRLIYPP